MKLLLALLGIGKHVWSWLTDVIGWLFDNPVRLILLGLALSCLVLAILLDKRTDERDAARSEAVEIQRAFDDTVEGYRTARIEADRLQDLRNQHVAQQQAAINERTSHDLQARLADARARADQLRGQLATAQADRGRADLGKGAALPGAAARAGEAPGAGGLPAAAQDDTDALVIATMNLAERLTATEQAIQLDELIDWVLAQVAVDPNAPARPD